jgi:cell division protein FtsZ
MSMPSRKPVVGAGQAPTQPIASGRAGKVTTPLFEPNDAASVAVHHNGATVSIGGDGGNGGISDDDVDVPPFMRH